MQHLKGLTKEELDKLKLIDDDMSLVTKTIQCNFIDALPSIEDPNWSIKMAYYQGQIKILNKLNKLLTDIKGSII